MAYAEVPVAAALKPPLLSPWECERVAGIGNPEARDRWLATRAVAKAIVADETDRRGIIDLRDGPGGKLVAYEAGLPVADLWISSVRRAGRIAVLVADRPAGMAFRRRHVDGDSRIDGVASRAELRTARIVFRDQSTAQALVWAIKEASLECLWSRKLTLGDVRLGNELSVNAGSTRLRPLALRVHPEGVVAVVVPARAGDPDGPLLVVDEVPAAPGGGHPRVRDAIDRQLARARRILEARSRRRPGWQSS